MVNVEQDKLANRIQEFRTQVELDNLRASCNVVASTSEHILHIPNSNSYKNIEALMLSAANGEVQTIKQGYLLKLSSSLRGDWKRRFFVLNSHGTLYYYRNKGKKPMGLSHQSTGISEHGSGMFRRFRSRHYRSSSMGEENLGYHTVNLQMSTIKIDAEHSDLRLCFRIVSPIKTYTLQAENEVERLDWVDKIRGVIASLLNSSFLENDMKNSSSSDVCESSFDGHISSEEEMKYKGHDNVSKLLRVIPGNDICAECSTSEPDWASLNLGILLCIECSGVHRNLGVHISKVRSITLDVKVWETPILDLFRNLGNAYCNSLWEGSLHHQNERDELDSDLLVSKPEPKDAFLKKEKYIQSKYVEKRFVIKEAISDMPSNATLIWEAVKADNLRELYRLIVTSDVNINTSYDEVHGSNLYHSIATPKSEDACPDEAVGKQHDPTACLRIKGSGEPANCMQGCSLLHLACHVGDIVMLELLLQFGADVNVQDFHGRTPLHHCISKRNNLFSKYLLRRGGRASIKDCGGLTVLERAMEMGAITDEKLFILLTKSE